MKLEMNGKRMAAVILFVFIMANGLQAGISFNPESSELTAVSSKSLDKLGKNILGALAKNKSMTVKINGYAEGAGSPEKNKKLSQKRADAVMYYLAGKFNIPLAKFQAQGYGLQAMLDSVNTGTAPEPNNRIEALFGGQKVILAENVDKTITMESLKPPSNLRIESGQLFEGIKGNLLWDGKAAKYNLQISRDREFKKFVINAEVQGTSKEVVPRKGEYYARVSSIDNAGARSNFSEVLVFKCEAAQAFPGTSAVKTKIKETSRKNVTKNYQVGYEQFNRRDSLPFFSVFLNSGLGFRYYNQRNKSEMNMSIVKRGPFWGRIDYEIGFYDLNRNRHKNIPFFWSLSYNLCRESSFQLYANVYCIDNETVTSISTGLAWNEK